MNYRELELRVIKEAKFTVDNGEWTIPFLAKAVRALREATPDPMALSARPTGAEAPPTSHQAARWQSARKLPVVWYILTRLAARPSTVDELEFRFKKPHQTVSARVNQLAKGGWIVATGNTRLTRSNSPAAVYTLTEAGRRALDEVDF